MNRRRSREQAFRFLFESEFEINKPTEILENATISDGIEPGDFSKKLFEGTLKNIDKIDKKIESNLKGWSKERLSKVVLAILRLACFEIIFDSDTPASVAINEAVELAKKYATSDESAYVNGVLGAVANKIVEE